MIYRTEKIVDGDEPSPISIAACRPKGHEKLLGGVCRSLREGRLEKLFRRNIFECDTHAAGASLGCDWCPGQTQSKIIPTVSSSVFP
jgi:hypothetical protein